MGLTADQLSVLRAELGDIEPPDDGDLDDLFLQYGGLVGVVRHVWRQRLANLLTAPASFSVPGEYSQSVAANITAIERRLAELAGSSDDSDDLPPGGGVAVITVVPMVRVGQDR